MRELSERKYGSPGELVQEKERSGCTIGRHVRVREGDREEKKEGKSGGEMLVKEKINVRVRVI